MGFSGHRKLFQKYSIFFYALFALNTYIIRILIIHHFPDWTHFRFDSKRILDALGKTRYSEGRLAGLLAFADKKELEAEIVTEDIVASYAIDGIALDKKAVRKDVDLRSKGNSPDIKIYLGAIENFANPFTRERLLGWFSSIAHAKASSFRNSAGDIEQGDTNMRFSGPGPERLESEMSHFFDWFENSRMDGIVKAAIAHFWFLTIRPFRSGNGRLARAMTALLLCRARNSGQLQYALNKRILEKRDDYFRTLNRAQCSNGDLTDWILWFIEQIGAAICDRESAIENEIKHIRFVNKISGIPLGEREQELLEAASAGTLPREFTAKDAATLFGTSHDTALREIQSLIKKGVVMACPKGGRSQRYCVID
jgi:Fic family protein